MKKVEVKVKGKRPLLLNAFRVEAISNLSKIKTGSKGNDPEEWKNTVLEKNGQLYIPGHYWGACLKDGSKYTKLGRGSIQKSFISSSLILDDFSLLDRFLPEGWEKMSASDMPKDCSLDVYLDIRGVMNPNSKGRNVRYRIACSPGWRTQFSFSFDEKIVSVVQVKKVLEDSGRMAGIGDGRVLGYGRFDIEECKISEYKD